MLVRIFFPPITACLVIKGVLPDCANYLCLLFIPPLLESPAHYLLIILLRLSSSR